MVYLTKTIPRCIIHAYPRGNRIRQLGVCDQKHTSGVRQRPPRAYTVTNRGLSVISEPPQTLRGSNTSPEVFRPRNVCFFCNASESQHVDTHRKTRTSDSHSRFSRLVVFVRTAPMSVCNGIRYTVQGVVVQPTAKILRP